MQIAMLNQIEEKCKPDPMAYNGNENNATEAPYRAVAIKKLERKQSETNNLVRNLIRKNDVNRPENEEDINRKKKLLDDIDQKRGLTEDTYQALLLTCRAEMSMFAPHTFEQRET